MNDNHDIERMVPGEHSPIEVLKFAAVIASIFLISIFLTAGGAISLSEGMRWFMGIFMVVFASFKLAGYKMFPLMFASYDVVAKRYKAYAYAYPFIELGLGLVYIFNLWPLSREIVTIGVFGVGSIGVAQEVRRRSGIHCACLGNIIKLPLSTTSLVEDAGMGLMALAMLLV